MAAQRTFRRVCMNCISYSHGKNAWPFRYCLNQQAFIILRPLLAPRVGQLKAFQTTCISFSDEFSNSFKKYTDQDWKTQLSPEQYHICREKGTEPPWSGELLNNKRKGIYSCVCCNADLFDWSTKFDSESGWPSFWAAIECEQTSEQKELGLPHLSVDQVLDESHGMVRIEVLCSQCGSHLGHVFHDGPKPTGLRYCINSVALHFTPSLND